MHVFCHSSRLHQVLLVHICSFKLRAGERNAAPFVFGNEVEKIREETITKLFDWCKTEFKSMICYVLNCEFLRIIIMPACSSCTPWQKK